MNRRALAIILAATTAALATGCEEVAKARRAAAPADLAVVLEAIGLQPEGGLPAQVRVTVRNRAAERVAFTLPRPLVALDGPSGREEMPLPVLALVLEDAQGHGEMPVCTEPKAKAWPKPKTAALEPGGEWSATYAIEQFYFWGPCGPDTGGSFAKYFWRGQTEVRMAAALVFGEGHLVRSDPVVLRCAFEDWLFRKKTENPSS